MRRYLAALLPAAVLLISASAAAQEALPFRDPTLSPEARAADIVSRMTLLEKAEQLRHNAPALPRLGIPEYSWWSEGLHGVARAGEATVFPQAIALAATWDAPLIQSVADVIGTEFRAKYRATQLPDGGSVRYRGLTVWSPNINIFRDPRWGRGQETFGEDPYLTSRIGVAFINGLHGSDPRHYKTVATAKHFAVHSGPEADRHNENVRPSAFDLEDTYLPAFRAAVVEADVQSVMCAYNAIDGIPACASPLLQDRVIDAWGFKGHIVSDCAAIADLFLPTSHGYVATPEEAVARAITAGTDLICAEFGPDKSVDPQIIVRAVEQGLLSEAAVDRAARRLFEARIRLGMFDPSASVAPAQIAATEFDTPAHRALAMQTARASMVLLKNDGLLPLTAAPRRIAVIGPNADSVDALIGNYAGTPSTPVTVVEGLRQRFPSAQVDYVEGTGLIGPPLKRVPDAAYCRDAACSAKGVTVEEFVGTALAGTPKASTDTSVRFSWGRPVRQPRQSSIRWTSWLTPEETGPYRFKLNSEQGYRILIDGKEVVNAWDASEPAMIADGEVQLEAGRRYALVVEAIQDADRGDQQLLWSNFGEREDAALRVARDADLIVYAAGLTARVEGEEMRVHAEGFAGGDRTSIDLPRPQQELLERLHATGKPVVLVLMNGSALGVNWADAHVPAIIEAWYPGGEGGRAVADLIAGDYSPAGRLPVTFYRSADQLPGFKDYGMAGRTYRYFEGEALYPFGYGLSYTRFTYSRPRVSRAAVLAGDSVTVSVDVTNSGERDGDEVVQLYLSRPGGRAIRALQGFRRIHLKAGQTQQVTFTLDARQLSTVDDSGERSVAPGPVDLWIGGGQPAARPGLAPVAGVAARFAIRGSKPLPK